MLRGGAGPAWTTRVRSRVCERMEFGRGVDRVRVDSIGAGREPGINKCGERMVGGRRKEGCTGRDPRRGR